jgi:hypothetical protein
MIAPALGQIRGDGGFGAVGEERVVAPDVEQFVVFGFVAGPPHDQPGGDWVFGGGERGELDLGDLGVGDQCPVSGSTTAPG